jgi:hypothetical protein
MLRTVIVGAAIVALLLMLVGSLGMIALSIGLILDYQRAPSDFGLGLYMGYWGLALMTPVAIVSSLGLRWVWRRRRAHEDSSPGDDRRA